MPNTSLASTKKRRLFANVVHSIILYGAPIWASDMSVTGIRELSKVQRSIALRVASAYCTVSLEAVLVISDMPPIDLLAREKQNISEGTQTHAAKAQLLEAWQERWDVSTNGRWTHRLIPKVDPWHSRKHGEVNFRITQALSGHGCFAQYLHRFGKLESPACWYCDYHTDDAPHTMFDCDAWHSRRNRANTLLGTTLTPDNLITIMLCNKSSWEIVSDFINQVMVKKEEDEKERHKINR